jgi:PAS domain S-box-containing protein
LDSALPNATTPVPRGWFAHLSFPHAAHLVQFYDHDEFLLKSVERFVGDGLRSGSGVIVIATRAHLEGLERRLAQAGVDVEAARAEGHLVELDAVETLSKFLVDGMPDPTRFFSTVGSEVERMLQAHSFLAAFGEMVALLWAEGNEAAALELERLWNELAKTHTFTLLCGYPMRAFEEARGESRFADVCGAHSHVIPAEGVTALHSPEEQRRVIAQLQEKARRLASEVAARQRVERELRAQQEELSDFFENAPVGLHCVDADGKILRANRAELELLGHSADEYVGRNVAEFHADPEKAQEILRRLAAGETLHGFEAKLRCKDGTIKDVVVDSSVYRVDGRFVHTRCFTRDVTERKSIERMRAELAAIVESSDDGIISKDLDGVIRSWNHGAERVLGYAAAEAIGRPISIIAPPGREAEMRRFLDAIKQGRRVEHFETKRRRKDGRIIDVSLTVSPVKDESGRIVGASKVLRDITEQKALEARLAVRAEQLAEADRSKDEFLAMLAHELRNPLAPIRNSLEFLRRRGFSDPEQEWARDVISRQVEHLTHLVDDLLDVSRITSGKVKLQKSVLELDGVIRHAVEAVRPLVDAHDHELAVSLPEEPILLEADETRLLQILTNLLENATKYTPPGGRIAVTLERDGADAVVAIRDTGIGIRPEMLERIFELFVQGDRSLDRSNGGLGIGLTLVRELVEMHGGTVRARSEGLGTGSEFCVRLPVSRDGFAPAELPSGGAAVAASGRRILVVDDNVDAADSVSLLLRIGGHEVRAAYDALDALEVAESFRPELVLLDIGLPRMNGYEVAARLREMQANGRPVLVAMTGYGQSEDRVRSERAGFDRHLVKPIDPAELESLIAALGPTP